MKRLLNILFLTLPLLVLSFCFTSCSDRGDDDLPPLYLRSLVITSQPTDAVRLGEKGVFEVKAKDFTSDKQNITFTFNPEQVRVWIDNQEMSTDVPTLVYINNTTLHVEMEPLVDGEIKVSMAVLDRNVNTSQDFTFRGSSMLYNVHLQNVPAPMYLGLRRSIDMVISDPSGLDAVTVDYLVSARVIKGKGVVHILDEMVWNDTLPSFEPIASEVPNSKWLMMYTGFEVGENQIEFTVEDSKGHLSISVASIWMSASEFDLTSKPVTVSPTIFENEMYDVQLSINAYTHIENRFFARGYFTKGSGEILMGDGKLSSDLGKLKPLYNRNPLCSVKPTTSGAVVAVVEIYDRYGTIHLVTIDFTVLSDNYQVSCGYEYLMDAMIERPFDLEISGSSDPNNAYQMSAEIVEGDVPSMQFKLNAADILGKGLVDVKANETMYVVANKAGSYKLKLTFKDKWSDAKEYLYDFTIRENPLQMVFSKDQHSVVLGSHTDYAQWTSQLSVMAGDNGNNSELYKDMKLTYTNNKEGNGVLKVNGSELVSHATATISGPMSTFYYTPSVVGRHTLAFVFTLKDGRTVTKSVTVDATDSPVTLNFSCPIGTLYDGESREISLLSSQKGYDKDLTYRFEFLEGSGNITKKDGSSLSAGVSYPLKQDYTERMDYTPGDYIGTMKIRYTVTGGSQQSAQGTASFKVESGLKMTLSTPQNVVMGSVSLINLEITKPNYTDQFSVRYDLVKPYPTYTGSGTIEGMTEGAASDMGSGLHTLKYTPTIAGKTRLKITVTDKTGKTVSNYVDFTTTTVPINLTLSTPQNVVMGSVSPINLEITKPNYTDQFSVRYDLVKPDPTYTGTGTIEGMTEGAASDMGSGSHILKYTPTIAGKTRLMITVTDKTGTTKSDYVEFTTSTLPVTVSPEEIVCPSGETVPINITIPNLGPIGKYEFSYTFCDKYGNPERYKPAILSYNDWEYDPKTLMEVQMGQTYTFEYDSHTSNDNLWIRFDLIDPYGITSSKVVNITHN